MDELEETIIVHDVKERVPCQKRRKPLPPARWGTVERAGHLDRPRHRWCPTDIKVKRIASVDDRERCEQLDETKEGGWWSGWRREGESDGKNFWISPLINTSTKVADTLLNQQTWIASFYIFGNAMSSLHRGPDLLGTHLPQHTGGVEERGPCDSGLDR